MEKAERGVRSRGVSKEREMGSLDDMKMVGKWREAIGLPKTPNTEDLWVNELLTNIFVFVVSTTTLYLGFVHVIPFVFIQFGDIVVIMMKMYITVIYLQCLMYWACTKLYCTQQIYSSHRPGVGNPGTPNFPSYDKPQTGLDMQGKSSLNTNDSTNGHSVNQPLINDPFTKEKELLSWQWCDACQINRPPRAQHCKLCNVCVLKRIHHCYVLNCCIGFSNQRHLMMMCALFSYACSTSGLVGLYYFYMKLYLDQSVWQTFSVYDVFYPYTVYRWWYFDTYETIDMIIYGIMHILSGAGGILSGYGIYEAALVTFGKTSYEIEKKLKIKDTQTIPERFYEVFGKFWFINFLLPGNLVMKQQGDGCNWEHIKIDYSDKDHK